MYNYILKPGDSIKKLDGIQKIDLMDYINMKNQGLWHEAHWLALRSMVVTNFGATLWQLSEKFLNMEESRAIGIMEAPVSLFWWIIVEQEELVLIESSK